MKHRSIVAAAIAAGLLLAGQASAGTDPRDARVDALIREQMAAGQIPGMQVAVVQGGKRVLLRSYGLSSIEHHVAVDDAASFSINSITKAFTGVAILQLQEAGKLSVDDPISRYIDGLPAPWQAVTLRQMLTNTSGLPDIVDETEHIIEGGVEDKVWAAVRKAPIQFQPGEAFSYNQTGWALLGQVITKLSGERFDKFIERNQFAAVGMPHTRFADSIDVVPDSGGQYTTFDLANGNFVLLDRPGVEHDRFPVFFRTAAGIWSSAEDLSKWVMALNSGKLLKRPESLSELWTPAILKNGKTGGLGDALNAYALGWPMVWRPQHPAAAAVGGARAAVFVYPKDDLSIIALTNLQGAKPEKFVEKIAAIYVPDIAAQIPAAAPPVVHHAIAVDENTLERYVGVYQLEPNVNMTITRTGDKLFATVPGQPGFELFAEAPNAFFLKAVDVQVSFTVDKDGTVVGLVLHQAGQDQTAPRLPAAKP